MFRLEHPPLHRVATRRCYRRARDFLSQYIPRHWKDCYCRCRWLHLNRYPTIRPNSNSWLLYCDQLGPIPTQCPCPLQNKRPESSLYGSQKNVRWCSCHMQEIPESTYFRLDSGFQIDLTYFGGKGQRRRRCRCRMNVSRVTGRGTFDRSTIGAPFRDQILRQIHHGY